MTSLTFSERNALVGFLENYLESDYEHIHGTHRMGGFTLDEYEEEVAKHKYLQWILRNRFADTRERHVPVLPSTLADLCDFAERGIDYEREYAERDFSPEEGKDMLARCDRVEAAMLHLGAQAASKKLAPNYTVFIRQPGYNTTYIDSCHAENSNQAVDTILDRCCGDWEVGRDDLRVMGVTHGDVNFEFWDDKAIAETDFV